MGVEQRGTNLEPDQPCVIVLESEPSLAQVMSDVLQCAGYAASVAANIAHLEQMPSRHSACVVITNAAASEPELRVEMLRRIRRATLARILLTGGLGLSGPVVDLCDAILEKPFSHLELLTAVNAARQRHCG